MMSAQATMEGVNILVTTLLEAITVSVSLGTH